MGYFSVAMFVGDPVGPTFHRRSVDLNGCSAAPTNQMVVVAPATAPAVDRLAVDAPDDVQFAGLRQCGDGSVDGCEPHRLAPGTQLDVKFLGTAEVAHLVEKSEYGRALPGRSDTGGRIHLASVPNLRPVDNGNDNDFH